MYSDIYTTYCQPIVWIWNEILATVLTDFDVVKNKVGAQDLLFGPLRIMIGIILKERLVLWSRKSNKIQELHKLQNV